MPIHDWTRVSPGTFHNFHHQWTASLTNSLNAGALPDGYFAMAEQRVGGPIPDVLTLQLPPPPTPSSGLPGGLAVATTPPKARIVVRSEAAEYAHRAQRITVRDDLGEVVTVIELASPGNKDTRHAIRAFSEKMAELLHYGIHLVLVDLFPPTLRDPQGLHKAIWDEISEQPFELPPDKPLTAAAYSADSPITAYVDPVAVGDALPSVPLFLRDGRYIPCPLEASYQMAWGVMPPPIRRLLEPPADPSP
jgi:hypothetical protein